MKLLPIQTPSKPQFDEAVNKVFQSPEYAYLKNGLLDFIENLKRMLGEWIADMIKRAAPDISSPARISDNISTAFMIIGLLVILGIIIVIIVNTSRTFDRKDRLKEILGEKIDSRTTPESLKKRALEFRSEGDLRMAIRYDFIALLLLMHERNIVYLDETKTNKEIFNYLKRNGFPKLNAFQYLINTFNHIWYGHKNCDNEGYDLWSEKINSLWKEVRIDEAKSE